MKIRTIRLDIDVELEEGESCEDAGDMFTRSILDACPKATVTYSVVETDGEEDQGA